LNTDLNLLKNISRKINIRQQSVFGDSQEMYTTCSRIVSRISLLG